VARRQDKHRLGMPKMQNFAYGSEGTFLDRKSCRLSTVFFYMEGHRILILLLLIPPVPAPA